LIAGGAKRFAERLPAVLSWRTDRDVFCKLAEEVREQEVARNRIDRRMKNILSKLIFICTLVRFTACIRH
jgi:hypothetical protein